MTATITKKITSSAVKGKDSLKACPSLCSSTKPLKEVKRTIKKRPIIPTGA